MAAIEFDTSEVRALSARLAGAATSSEKGVRAVVERGANNIKRQLRNEARGSRHFRGNADQFAQSITYDLRTVSAFGGGAIEAEIGPTKGSSGSLANIAYFGGAHGGGGTLPDPQGALDAETPALMKYLANLAADAV